MIWFMAPDLPEASGGLVMIHRMVEALTRSGIDACVWHGTDKARYDTFASGAPVVRALKSRLDAGDILVMPEKGAAKWRFLTGDLPVILLVQGQAFVFDDLDLDAPVTSGYPGRPEAVAALVVSEYLERVVRLGSGPGFPVFRVPPEVDSALFSPAAKERLITYMPRRRSNDLEAAVHLLRRGGLLPDGWRCEPIHGESMAGVGRALGRSTIFMSGAQREGFGLPGAEAMAAGCYVVGFTGDGGREFLTDDVAAVVHDNDFVELAEQVAAAARRFDSGDAELRDAAGRGRERVLERYSADAMNNAVVAALRELAGRPGVRIQHAAEVTHFQAHAPREGAFWAAYVGLRRAAGAARRRLSR